jgi:hypothetical protein
VKTYVLAKFADEGAVLSAARALREKGHRALDIHSPVPIHGAEDALGLRPSKIPLLALMAGLTGAATGFLMQWWMVGFNYPLNVGNRPPLSLPAFVPIIFELSVLFAAGAIFFGVLILAGFPRTHHPVFEVEGFRSASVDGIWLSAEIDSPNAHPLVDQLRTLGAREVSIVPEDLQVVSP